MNIIPSAHSWISEVCKEMSEFQDLTHEVVLETMIYIDPSKNISRSKEKRFFLEIDYH